MSVGQTPQPAAAGAASSQVPEPSVEEEIDRLVARAWQRIAAAARPVACTYRLQLQPGILEFRDASALVGYLDALGISHLYASPILKCRRGSTHGYDIVDHGAINHALGDDADLAALDEALRRQGMRLLLDWVPNHMAIGSENPQWMDVLENGPAARSARYFDIDWRPVKPELASKVLLPILGDQYGVILERGELRLGYENGSFFIAYWEHRFPVAPRSYATVLALDLDRLHRKLGDEHPDLLELLSVLSSIRNLPGEAESDPARLEEQRREKEVVKRRLAALCNANSEVRAHVEQAVERLNQPSQVPATPRELHQLLEQQFYRLAYWRVAAEEINYRRFFDVNELVAIRMEDAEVFEHAHALLWGWVETDFVRCLRIDHPDGLYDPGEYFHRLQTRTLISQCRCAHAEQPSAIPWTDLEQPLGLRCSRELAGIPRSAALPLFIVVEKVLGRRERLPDGWCVSGTTGYDFLNAVNGIFVDREGAKGLDAAYTRFLGRRSDYQSIVRDSKKLILDSALASELQVLAHRLDCLSEAAPRTRDFTLGTLQAALAEVIAAFPVYRTYLPSGGGEVDVRDRQYVQTAVSQARRHSRAISPSVFEFIQSVLLQSSPEPDDSRRAAVQPLFSGKLQQLTGPAMAKGMEDTTFYSYNRLISLNEVGGEPDRIGVTASEFHAQNRERLSRAPGSLLSTTTHDTKRSEDVRLRIDVLSELPEQWLQLALQWARLNRRLKRPVAGSPAPDRNDEYFLYQTLLGTFPDSIPGPQDLDTFRARIEAYLTKAVRESKTHSSWIDPRPEYETALLEFTRALLARPFDHPFWRTFLELQRRLAWAGRQSSLSQLVLKAASPGTPDIYQGSELWDLRLVDPDNRSPVDFALRAALLEEMTRRGYEVGMEQLARELANSPDDGRIKLFVTWRSLTLRRNLAAAFAAADYQPLEAQGELADHVVAFSRSSSAGTVVAVTARLFVRLGVRTGQPCEGLATGRSWWRATRLPLPATLAASRFRDRFTERIVEVRPTGDRPELALSDVFATLPAALLEQLPG
ncbi:MAG: malto-oligosyltrehalose synthase [Candidatus Wallbacteria bacterium]|nr:malto-oligosyltrehalose synthase [Candidatus Wallbacteria bacterium]